MIMNMRTYESYRVFGREVDSAIGGLESDSTRNTSRKHFLNHLSKQKLVAQPKFQQEISQYIDELRLTKIGMGIEPFWNDGLAWIPDQVRARGSIFSPVNDVPR